MIALGAGVFLACTGYAEVPKVGAFDVAVVLGVVLLAAAAELVGERGRAVLCVGASVLTFFSAAGVPFLALATYDYVRDFYGQRAFRGTILAPIGALVVCAAKSNAVSGLVLSSAACMMLAALVSWRTTRMLSRVATITRTRDEAALANTRLYKKNAQLQDELVNVSAKLEEQLMPTAKEPVLDSMGRPDSFLCLTEREFEVARLVAEGLDNKEIAATAFMSEGTVRNHISRCLTKLALKNRTQLALEYWHSLGRS